MSLNPATFQGRFLVFGLLITAPFVRFLIGEGYGFAYPEVILLLGIHAAAAGVLGLLTRLPTVRDAAVVGLITVFGTFPLSTLIPSIRLRYLVLFLLIVFAVAIYYLRESFYKLLPVFIFALLGGELITAFWPSSTPSKGSIETSGKPLAHTLHIIFDAMQGLGATPEHCASCRIGVSKLQATLANGQFISFPYAFSNYRTTVESIPSLLNNQLLVKADQFVVPRKQSATLEENAYFRDYASNGYDIRTYETDYLVYSAAKHARVSPMTYKSAGSASDLHELDISWRERLAQIVARYVFADRFWYDTWTKLAPESLHTHTIAGTAIISSRHVLPQVLHDMKDATKNTLFFVHLLDTHYPFVVRPDGTFKPYDSWFENYAGVFRKQEDDAYRAQYEAYGDQLQFMADRLEAFLLELRKSKNYEAMTIILHGDHGARIRIVEEPQMTKIISLGFGANDRNVYDYADGSEPDGRDLANRFATFLALKLPFSKAGQTEKEPGSLLYFFRRYLWNGQNASAAGINSVYLFDGEGQPREIPMLRYWPLSAQVQLQGDSK